MADKRDYYEVLGIDKTADEAQIKSAFRKQAKTCHPDLHPGDKAAEARFKELNEAAEILGDPEKRAKYDQFGHAAFDPASGGAGYSPYGGSGFGGFNDIIDTIFGGGFSGGNSRTGPMQGNDLRYTLTISFEDAAFGVKREIVVPREDNCATCDGTGAKPGTTPERCQTCGGSGQVRSQQNTMFGTFASTRPCSACGGTGKIIKEQCFDCRGTGRMKKSSRIVINVPAGIDNGQTLNMRGEGEAGLRGGERGDLFITIRVKPHKEFVREGYDLHLEMKIPFTTAALGGEIRVPTLTGTVKYTIPEGTQTGTVYRMREQGIQRLRGNGKGDLLVTVKVDVPKRLNERQKEALREFSNALGENRQEPEVKQNKKGFFRK